MRLKKILDFKITFRKELAPTKSESSREFKITKKKNPGCDIFSEKKIQKKKTKHTQNKGTNFFFVLCKM